MSSKHFKMTVVDMEDPIAAPAEPVPAVEPPSPATPAEPVDLIPPPPNRFSKLAKEQWSNVPEVVRNATLRLHEELSSEFKKVKAAAMRDRDLAPFHDMASKGGKTLGEVLQLYTNTENLLRSDFDKGIDAIIRNLGIDPRDLATVILADCRGYPAVLVAQIAQAVRDGRVKPGTHWAGSDAAGDWAGSDAA